MTEDGKIERVSTDLPGEVIYNLYYPAHGEPLLFKGQRIYAIEALGCDQCCIGTGSFSCDVPNRSGMSCSSRQFVDEVTWLKIQMRGES